MPMIFTSFSTYSDLGVLNKYLNYNAFFTYNKYWNGSLFKVENIPSLNYKNVRENSFVNFGN